MLLGRGRELDAIETLLSRARLNESAALVVTGEVGIGKTALLEAAASSARTQGMRVLRARGVESEARVPFAALLHLRVSASYRLFSSGDYPSLLVPRLYPCTSTFVGASQRGAR